LELLQATRHISPTDDIDDDEWGQVKYHYQRHGDVDGGGTSYSMALRMKHDFFSDSVLEFILPVISLLILGIAAYNSDCIKISHVRKQLGVRERRAQP
jgi:hypothetical protein